MQIYQAEVLRAICICGHFADLFSLSQLLLRFTSSTKYQSFAFLFYNELRRSLYDSPSICKQKQKTKRPGENNIPSHTKTTHLHQRFFERSTTTLEKKNNFYHSNLFSAFSWGDKVYSISHWFHHFPR